MRVSDEQLITAFLECGGNQRKTAEKLGISAVWVCKRLQNDRAQELLRDYRKEILTSNLNRIIALNERAIKNLKCFWKAKMSLYSCRQFKKY